MPEAGEPVVNPLVQEPYRPEEGSGLIRMMVVQAVQSFIINRKSLKTPQKVLCIFAIFIALVYYDFNNYFESKARIDLECC
jgi:hypothetical protein